MTEYLLPIQRKLNLDKHYPILWKIRLAMRHSASSAQGGAVGQFIIKEMSGRAGRAYVNAGRQMFKEYEERIDFT